MNLDDLLKLFHLSKNHPVKATLIALLIFLFFAIGTYLKSYFEEAGKQLVNVDTKNNEHSVKEIDNITPPNQFRTISDGVQKLFSGLKYHKKPPCIDIFKPACINETIDFYNNFQPPCNDESDQHCKATLTKYWKEKNDLERLYARARIIKSLSIEMRNLINRLQDIQYHSKAHVDIKYSDSQISLLKELYSLIFRIGQMNKGELNDPSPIFDSIVQDKFENLMRFFSDTYHINFVNSHPIGQIELSSNNTERIKQLDSLISISKTFINEFN